MAIQKKSNIPLDRIELYKKVIQTVSGIELKGATMPYTSVNGHMFSFLDKDGKLALRLPKQDREEFISKYMTKLCEANGTVLKEYVLVPDDLFRSTAKIKKYFAMSFAYVSSLKPKATKN